MSPENFFKLSCKETEKKGPYFVKYTTTIRTFSKQVVASSTLIDTSLASTSLSTHESIFYRSSGQASLEILSKLK